MPCAPLVPCRDRLCPELIPRGAKWCTTHKTEHYRREDADRGTSTQRGYDRRWRKLRDMVVAQEPLCRVCRRAATTEVDHIIRTQDGGAKRDRQNLQGLCKACHSRKTMREISGDELYRPTIGKARCPVTVVCGPPGSGKNAWVDGAAGDIQRETVLFDLDTWKAQLAHLPVHHAGPEWVERALRVRNQSLSNLCAPWGIDRFLTFLIVSAPKSADRRWWRETLGANEVVLCEVDAAECERRIRADDSRLESLKQDSIDAAYRWWEAYSADYQDRVNA